ncbi:amidophosphoribosyltransferase [Synergistales bacterium]|nr:amidophosphoribosyltransferase [Synergistales bacterium]
MTEDDFDDFDKLNEKCGLFGFWSEKRSVADVCYLGLFALQHRGQEGAGIVTTDGMHIDIEKGAGLMTDVFRKRLPSLKGHCGIGHVRYSTFGGSSFENIQPFLASFVKGGGFISLAHNGSLTNAKKIRTMLEADGCRFQSTSDSESMLNLIAHSTERTIEEKILRSLNEVEGAFSLVIMTGDKLFGVRDPLSFRPLCIGKIDEGEFVIASESCALDAVGADFIRDVAPGEMVVIDKSGLHSYFLKQKDRLSFCVFEYIYFARPDSVIDGRGVWQARYDMGRQLAREFLTLHDKSGVDIVVPVPDTGIAAAIGFAAESGLPYVEGLIKNRYVGRTFILPEQKSRKASVDMKLNPIRENLRGKRVVLIDDSIVRGTTSARLIELLRHAGALEVHMCVSSPPITHPCYYGIDTSKRKELIASVLSENDTGQKIGTDSLRYLSLEGLLDALDDSADTCMCTACFHGRYPTDVGEVQE